jgi:hypothetical protein
MVLKHLQALGRSQGKHPANECQIHAVFRIRGRRASGDNLSSEDNGVFSSGIGAYKIKLLLRRHFRRFFPVLVKLR